MLDFTATWCPPCKMLKPILLEIAEELKDKLVLIVADVDNNEEFSTASGVNGIPNILFFKGGNKVDSFVGMKTKEQVMEIVNKHL